jgi:formate dehydrogenase iron-sulfur subunit
MVPACAKHCPTASIQFGDLSELRERARERVDELHRRGMPEAYLYGHSREAQPGTEGLNAFFLLVDRPEAYNLPPDPAVPTKKARRSWGALAIAALGMAALAFGAVRTP